MQINVRALWLATNSAYGERLLQIAQEHSRLDCDLHENDQLSLLEKEVYKVRIEQLRNEREMILNLFDGVKV
ncbi:hypothetical protein HP398_29935 [Brevibacillus sp. HB1.4B]|uniref:hypothetical protein n=1 Tax=Brevibacillus sp. HB1.4B TaxID=2738845 RepID=UPI00156B08D2|nr:hypothetical protein [Brevibacillus sp. HB1.4B]NRS20644.1 hypothetical protein [Brevibacillus sp. HB1.4B]